MSLNGDASWISGAKAEASKKLNSLKGNHVEIGKMFLGFGDNKSALKHLCPQFYIFPIK